MHRKDSDSPVARVPLPAKNFELEDVTPEEPGEPLNPYAPITHPPATLSQNDFEQPANFERLNPPILHLPLIMQAQAMPALVLEPVQPVDAVARKIIELVETPDNIDEVITFINSTPSQQFLQPMTVDVPNSVFTFNPYTYVVYKERFDILRVMLETISREQVIFPVNQLILALLMGHHFSEIELLIECGANIFSPIKEGSSIEILDFVYTFNRLDVLDYLVKSKRLNLAADIKRRPFRLHQAVEGGADLMVERLLLCGADPHARIDSKILLPNQADENPREIMPMETLVEVDVKSRVSLLEFFEQNPTPLSVSGLKSNFSRTVQLMLETGADYTIANQFGENVFHILALYGIDHALGERLVKIGLDINQQTKYAHTPLHIAAKMGQLESLRSLLALGANPKIQDDLGRYPVYYSRHSEAFNILCSYYGRDERQTGNFGIAEKYEEQNQSEFDEIQSYLVGTESEKSASMIDEHYVENLFDRLMMMIISKDIVTIQNMFEEHPPLKNFIEKMRNIILRDLISKEIEDSDIFRFFLSIVSDGNLSNDYIHILLDEAIRTSNKEVCEFLLAVTPSDVLFSKDRLNPVFKCCEYNRLELIQILEKKGVDIHLTLVSGLSTLHVACENRSAEVAIYLIKKGADIHAKFLDRGDLISRAPIDIVQRMLDDKVRQLDLSPTWCDPLAQHIKILRVLNFNFFNDVDCLAKHYNDNLVILSTDDDLNDLLLKHIAQWDVVLESGNIDTPQCLVLSRALLYAARYGALKNVQTLMRFGALINYTDQLGWSALHWSVLFKRTSLTQYLIESGADTTLQTPAGFTPLQLAYNSAVKKNLRSYLISMCTPIVPKEIPPTSLELSLVGVVPLPEQLPDTKTTWKLSLSDLHFPQTAKLKAIKYLMHFDDWPNVVPNLTGIMEHLTSSTLEINQTLPQGYSWPYERQYRSPLRFKTASDGYTFESLVCLEARDIAIILENSNPCRAALLDLSSKGFRGMQTLELNQHYATPGLKLLYDHRDQNTPVGFFVRCNLLTIQRARKEILYKALVANSLFKVCPSPNIVNILCGTITHDDIPKSDSQSSALMKMLPGTSGAQKQSGPQS